MRGGVLVPGADRTPARAGADAGQSAAL